MEGGRLTGDIWPFLFVSCVGVEIGRHIHHSAGLVSGGSRVPPAGMSNTSGNRSDTTPVERLPSLPFSWLPASGPWAMSPRPPQIAQIQVQPLM